jgi:hypothetical protein
MVVTTNAVIILEFDPIHFCRFLRDAGTYLPNYMASHPISHNDSTIRYSMLYGASHLVGCCEHSNKPFGYVNYT